ncbi:MAG: radical SAM protein [Methanomicrobiaceae archaeon]|nr:radical SAM protein [Methanomicrobiaceae archaeon]
MKISELFRSIQGEGRNQGCISVFVRLAGCNLDCTWCDTRYAREEGADMAPEEVAAQVGRLGGRRVCITGGEPLLQADELLLLLDRLRADRYIVEIETNGTLDFRPFREYAAICMDVKCPSSGETSDTSLLAYLTARDCVKFVVGGHADLEYARSLIGCVPTGPEILVTPVEGSDLAEIAGYILAHNLPVRLQVQLHKIIGVK